MYLKYGRRTPVSDLVIRKAAGANLSVATWIQTKKETKQSRGILNVLATVIMTSQQKAASWIWTQKRTETTRMLCVETGVHTQLGSLTHTG